MAEPQDNPPFQRAKSGQVEDVQIVTLAEGEITELHIGLKGTMNQLFLKDLAAKTRRGLRGRVEAGRSGGGNIFGYDVVRRFGPDGSSATGERQSTLRRRGRAPDLQAYAPALAEVDRCPVNREGVRGPRGGAWSSSTITAIRCAGPAS